MAETTVVAVPRDGTISITNGDATVYTVAFENGDMSMNLDLAERIVIYDRGSIVGLRQGNDPVPSISFSVHLRELADSTEDTLLDFIYKTGNSSAATSTGGTGFEQFLCTVEFQANMSALSGSNTKVTFNKVLLFASVAEGNPDTISVTGEVYGSIVRAEV
jgi:spore coat protein U-like protein